MHGARWRNYYGLGSGEPGGPQPQWAKWEPTGSGCRAKTLARASDMSQCRFLTIRIRGNGISESLDRPVILQILKQGDFAF